MKPITASAVLVGITIILAVALAATAAPPKAAPVVQKSPLQMTPAELAQLQIPPGSSLQIRRVSPRTSLFPNLVGPDLVVLDPVYEGTPKQAPPGWSGSGYYADLYVMNQGNRPAGPTNLKLECDVVGGTPGSGLNQFVMSQWCNSFNTKTHPILGLDAGKQYPPAGQPYQFMAIKIFLPPPIFSCSSAYPRARFTATVDPDNTVAETGVGETNNVLVVEMCYAP